MEEKNHSLWNMSLTGKVLPPSFKSQALKALSHYPELENATIIFIEKPARFPLKSFPDPHSLLVRKRKYKIVISTKTQQELENILLKKLPLKAQVGVLGHELAHTLDYSQKTVFQIIKIGFLYLFNRNFRVKFEKRTDEITIAHGLGEELLTWRLYYESYLETLPSGQLKQQLFFEDRYLTAKEIKERMTHSKS